MAESTQKILKLWESYYPIVLSTVITIIFFCFCPDVIAVKVFTKDIITVTITITGILFGFLLTVLALLMQSDSKSMKLIKVYGRFGELVKFNKRAVYSSALSLLLSLAFLIINDLKPEVYLQVCLLEIFKWLWFFVVTATILKTYRYVDIFYNLIKD